MSNETIKDEDKYRYPLRPLDMKLQLNNVKNTRNSMARVTREYCAGRIEHLVFRNLVYMFSQLISGHRLESDLRIEDKIRDLEARINEQCKNG